MLEFRSNRTLQNICANQFHGYQTQTVAVAELTLHSGCVAFVRKQKVSTHRCDAKSKHNTQTLTTDTDTRKAQFTIYEIIMLASFFQLHPLARYSKIYNNLNVVNAAVKVFLPQFAGRACGFFGGGEGSFVV